MAESWYHAGQLEWEMGEYHGLTGRMTYTYGKALDTGAEATDQGGGDVQSFPLRPGESTYAKGFSRFDVRNRFTLATSYSFPWLMNRNDWMSSVFGGWTLAAGGAQPHARRRHGRDRQRRHRAHAARFPHT